MTKILDYESQEQYATQTFIYSTVPSLSPWTTSTWGTFRSIGHAVLKRGNQKMKKVSIQAKTKNYNNIMLPKGQIKQVPVWYTNIQRHDIPISELKKW